MLGPYVEMGRFETFKGNVTLVPGIRAVATVSHTPGQSNYEVASQGRSYRCGVILCMSRRQLDD
jgi:hypothetical protein